MTETNPLRFAEPGSPQWVDAWRQLSNVFGDPVAMDPENGETWQYMGTVRRVGALAVEWVHEFRHRSYIPRALRGQHAAERRRLYARFGMAAPVPADWTEERWHDSEAGIRSALSGVPT